MDLNEAQRMAAAAKRLTSIVDVNATTVEIDEMRFTIMADKEILMPNDTPNAESNLVETYNVETTTVDKIWKEGGLARLTEGIK